MRCIHMKHFTKQKKNLNLSENFLKASNHSSAMVLRVIYMMNHHKLFPYIFHDYLILVFHKIYDIEGIFIDHSHAISK